MKEYNNPDEYIADVKSHIKWKRAKIIATQELLDHINDQYDAFLDRGLSPKDAMKKTITEMGSAETVGKQLNEVHQPKTNWELMVTTGALLLLGLTVSLLLTSATITMPKVVGIILGACAAVILYFIDYTILIRYPNALYWILSATTCLLLTLEVISGMVALGYCNSYLLLLCFPLVLIGILFHVKNTKSKMGILIFLLYAMFPLILSLIAKSIPIFVVLFLCDVFIFVCGLKKQWLKWNKENIIFSIFIVIVFGVIVGLFARFYGLQNEYLKDANTLYEIDFQSVLDSSKFIGQADIEIADMMRLYIHPITMFLYKYGQFPTAFLIFIFIGLLYFLFRAGQKQNTEIGKMLMQSVVIIIAFRLATTILADLGFINNFFMNIPFVVTGGLFIVYDLILIGVVLSVNRNESIAQDWIMLKDKMKHQTEGSRICEK